MSTPQLKVSLYLILGVSIVFLKFGRSLWYPLYLKVVGKKTVEEVYEQLAPSVEPQLRQLCAKVDLAFPPEGLTLIGLKDERRLEVWAQASETKRLIQTYNFTGYSGQLGPKLASGDGQIPEGLYAIEYLNPNSSYHLSAKLSYPNAFDREQGRRDSRSDLGGDIFIHGSSATIGCIPIGDAAIEELFTLLQLVGIEKVDVIIAPNDLRRAASLYDDPANAWLGDKYRRIQSALINFQ